MLCEERFFEIYKREPEALSYCPYRVCPVGAHVDHQFGKITGLAIDKGITLAYKQKNNGVIELSSLQFDKRAQFHIQSIPETKCEDWADYLRGVTIELAKRYRLHTGLCGVIEGSLPIGGLSSSAAVTLSYLNALCRVNGIKLTDSEMIQFAQSAENSYVGVSSGKLDQSCEIFCRKDKLLYLDTLDDSYILIPTSQKMKPYDIVIFFSGVERNLAGSKFNMRVDECRSAAYALKAFAEMEYGKFNQTHMREVPREIYDQYKERLPHTWRLRAEHFYTENERVEKATLAWMNGDIESFGKCIFESGYSSIYNWQTGSDELKTIYDLMTKTDGIYGGRFCGAGFKGCCMAIVDPSYTESVMKNIGEEYCKVFPNLKDKYLSTVCHSSDGLSFQSK